MPKEISDILFAFKEAQLQGRQTALATVVHVEGSSYRRPGARMLVEDNGKMTGAISGGCLEGDALRKALLAINQRQKKLVTYNTLHKDDVEFGVQLGCNGIVHILFEPIDPMQPDNPIGLLEKFHLQRQDAVLATLFSLKNFSGDQPGTCFFLNGQSIFSTITNKYLEAEIKEDALMVLTRKSSTLKQYSDNTLAGFVELLQPPVSLIIVGAGNDAMPLVEMATVLGWQITMIDGRATHANNQRFPKTDKIIVGKPVEAMRQVVIDETSVVVLMTHNYNYDLAVMKILLQNKCRYIGTLGPKARLQRMLAELLEEGHRITDEQVSMLYGPTGLDIGAESAEEIALSVLAEIKAVLSDRNGNFLRARLDGIHSRSVSASDEPKQLQRDKTS
ncbi:MAG: XdhC family protein [Chitinophagaceae bacterium]|nr:XdhC family protein [Chitinophagaceae bacterium]